VPIREINTGEGALSPTGFERILGGKRALMLCDYHTKSAVNDRLAEDLREHGWKLKVREFQSERLKNDDAVVGTVVLDTEPGMDGIVAVGGGTVTDLGRFVASRLGKPFILVMTCPSMDGYASNVAAVAVDGRRKIFKDCRYPDAIFGDMAVIGGAPFDLIKSGFGDMLGKRTALPDWALSRRMTGEYFCERAAALMDESSMNCVLNLNGLISRDARAIAALTDALVMTGVCMALVSDTRPASGSEHIFSHFMVESALDSGSFISHGVSVGFGTLISTLLYRYLLEELHPAELESITDELLKYLLPPEQVWDLLTNSRITADIEGYLSGEAIAEMIRRCAAPDKRYTILRYLSDCGHLENGIRYTSDALGKIAGQR
jgi:glycerol-1-phosphate dehydrogenase [NAD(P)+]